ncbi:hypothetical protein D1007_15769 [Hordeum vulgare]|nr:hypothetical protein D1007_15769 [Hordeum vulgare]
MRCLPMEGRDLGSLRRARGRSHGAKGHRTLHDGGRLRVGAEGRGNAERHLCHQPARHVRGRATRRAMVMLRLWEDAGAAHRLYLAGARGRRCQPPQWGMATGWAAPRHERPWSSLPSAAGSADTQGPRQAQPSLDA